MKSFSAGWLGSALIAVFTPALALEIESADPARVVRAARTATAPTIDGRLDPAEWAAAPLIGGLVQDEPDNGAPATVRTEIRILYDDHTLYVGARLDDPQPVTRRIGRRDANLESDWFHLFLDPHHDHRTGARFAVNPSGVQSDWLLFNDSSSDQDWDAVWKSAVSIDQTGWTVELAIPYSQLRFPDLPTHVWGINFQRYLSRRNEVSELVHVERDDYGLVSRFAHLEGIEGIRPARNLEVIPHVVVRTMKFADHDPDDPFSEHGQLSSDLGATFKYGMRSNLTLTGAINPDFGQVEVDPAVVNLTAFETFYPERRPFFLEGLNHFGFQAGDLFHSRRIGRAPQGGIGDADFSSKPRQTTILAAAKVTGKTPGGWSIGLLDAVTDEERGRFLLGGERGTMVVEPRTNYFAARVGKDIGGSSDIGAIVTSVIRDDDSALDGTLNDRAFAAGLDGTVWFGDRDWLLEWAAAASRVDGSARAIERTQRSPLRYYARPDADHVELDPNRTSLEGWTGKLRFLKASGEWRTIASVQSTSPGFEINDLGFLSRADLTAAAFHVIRRESDPGPYLRAWTLSANYNHSRNHDGDVLRSSWIGRASTTLLNYWSLSAVLATAAESTDDRGTRGGPLARFPATHDLVIGISSDSRRRLWFATAFEATRNDEGGFRRHAGLSVTARPTSSLSLSLEPSFTRERLYAQYVRTVPDPLAAATFGARYVFAEVERTTFEAGTRLNWAYTPTLSVDLYVQPLLASGDYGRFKELAVPGTLAYHLYGVDRGTVVHEPVASRYTVDPDGAGPAVPFGFADPDFNLRSVRGNLVVRWEYRSGSAVYLAWTRDGSSVERFGDFDFARDADALANLESDDVFLLKVGWWFDL